MRIVFITQRIDPADPVLGATVAKIVALAARCDEGVVLTDRAVGGALPPNTRVRLFRSGSRVGRGLRFGRALASELSGRDRPSAVIAHMCPIYAVLAAPLARPLGVRVLLWYAHWNRTRTLDLAVRVSTAALSVDVRSVPVDSSKIVAIGHGIDVSEFPCGEPPDGSPHLVALGRYSAAKGLETIVQAVGVLRKRGIDASLECHGTRTEPAEQDHYEALVRLVTAEGLDDAVILGPPVPRGDVPLVLRRATALVNNMRAGAPDKVVFEAAASCVPVLVSNPSFDDLLEGLGPLRFPRDNANALADAVSGLVALSQAERSAIGHELRSRVSARHSVDSWADAVVRLAAGQASTS